MKRVELMSESYMSYIDEFFISYVDEYVFFQLILPMLETSYILDIDLILEEE